MDARNECPLAAELAERLRGAGTELTYRWLDRITARVSMDPNRIFPTEQLIDHIPLLLMGIADHIEDPADEISADMPVVAKAMELGELRHEQGFDAHEILKEYEILGGVLFAFLISVVDDIPKPCTRGELLGCAQRLFRGIMIIQQATANHYLRVANERVRERENRLHSFNLMVSHELRNRLGAVLSAGDLLGTDTLDPRERERFATMVSENARGLQALLENLVEVSRIDNEARVRRDVPLSKAAAEAARQLRKMAEEHGVEVRLADDLPDVRVNAAAVELCLSNYLSNAIKHSDPRKPERWAEVRGHIRERDEKGARELVVEVRDNGVGVSEADRAKLFERFFRAREETITGAEGMGLGLSIVRDTMESLGGHAGATFHDDGSTFFFSFPLPGVAEDESAE